MNKPVAWMNKTEDETVFIENTGNTKVIGGNPIPLYTHPVNTCKHGVDDGACKECYQEVTHPAELTDEEILAISNENYIENKGGDIDFARAILRKAQATCNGFCGEYECKENQSNCKRKASEK